MTHLNKADFFVPCPQRLHDTIDPVARQTEDSIHAPITQGVDQNVRSCSSHGLMPGRNRAKEEMFANGRGHEIARTSTAFWPRRTTMPRNFWKVMIIAAAAVAAYAILPDLKRYIRISTM